MSRASRRASALALLAALAGAAPALAQWAGSGPVIGPEKVSVPGCGKSRGTFDGGYSVSHSGSLLFPGTYSASSLHGQFSGLALVAGNLLDKNFDGRSTSVALRSSGTRSMSFGIPSRSASAAIARSSSSTLASLGFATESASR
jgi:hypothetical protein